MFSGFTQKRRQPTAKCTLVMFGVLTQNKHQTWLEKPLTRIACKQYTDPNAGRVLLKMLLNSQSRRILYKTTSKNTLGQRSALIQQFPISPLTQTEKMGEGKTGSRPYFPEHIQQDWVRKQIMHEVGAEYFSWKQRLAGGPKMTSTTSPAQLCPGNRQSATI